MDFKDLVQKRRSIRSFTDEVLTDDEIRTILRAGLMAPTGHGYRNWQFVCVTDKELLHRLSVSKSNGAEFLGSAVMAVVVAYDKTLETWIEDASIAAVTMQYQASELGLGSCWAQVRGRETAEGQASQEYLDSLLSLGENKEVVCILGFGHPAIERKLQDEGKLRWDAVRWCPGDTL